MTNKSATAMVAAILKTKLAGADVDPEALQAAIGVGGGAGAPASPEAAAGGAEAGLPGAGGEEAGIQQLLASLSPEELEQLAASLAADMQNPQADQGGADVAALAQAIEGHLGQNPEAEVAGAAPEKAAELKFIKSAGYISGFLTEVMAGGADSTQAVNLYDQALSSKLAEERAIVKQAAEHQAESAESVKLAAYFDGIAARANELGFSEAQTVELLKSANELPSFEPGGGLEPDGYMTNPGTTYGPEGGLGGPGGPGLLDKLKSLLGKGVDGAQQLGHQVADAGRAAVPYIQSGLGKAQELGGQGLEALRGVDPELAKGLGIGALGAGALGLGAYGVHKLMHRNDNKHKEEGMEVQAAYYDGVFKRAQEYGFSRDEAIQLIQSTRR